MIGSCGREFYNDMPQLQLGRTGIATKSDETRFFLSSHSFTCVSYAWVFMVSVG